jgi:outer membrane protein assembly factor BamB
VKAGYAGPAVAEGRVYLMDRVVSDPDLVPDDPFQRGEIPGLERVLCFDDASGEMLWKHEYERAYTVSYPLGPRVTPTVADGKVYTLGAEGDLLCLAAADGGVIWAKNFGEDYGAPTPVWGFASHPLVDGRKVITLVGGEGSAVVAFDKETGEEIWRSLTVEQIGYCPPVIYEVEGKRQLVVFHGEGVAGLEPETGEPIWSVPLEVPFAMSIAIPRKFEDTLFVMPYRRNSTLLRFVERGQNVETVWKASARMSIHGTMSTPFIEDGYLYGDDADGEFRCVELATGKRLWTSFEPTTGRRPERWSNVFLVHHEPTGHYVLFNEHGELITADLSPEGYEEISRARIVEPTSTAGNRPLVWTHPAFANGCVYARNDKELVKVSLSEN